jgi:peptide/nickel transport system substrate-binding protein
MSSTRRKVLAAMGGASTVAIAGCGVFDSGDGGGEGDPNFVGSLGANPSTFDPTVITDATSNSAIGTMAYENLIDLTFDLSELRAALATDWEQVDEETYEFTLREGVEFQTGSELTADDVVFSVERMRGTANDATVASFTDVSAVDEMTVQFQTDGPYAPALTDISGIPILPSDFDGISESPQDDSHDFTSESIGTGPWELTNFAAEDRVELEPFDNYWADDENPWETVTLRVITEQVSQEEAMMAGELDMIDNPAPFDLGQWEGEDPEPITTEAVGFDFVSYPVTQSPYSNPKFRRGMTRLIPRNEVIEAIFGNNATALAGPVSPGLGSYWDEEHEQRLLDEYVGQDEEAAMQLLDEAFEEEDIEPPFELSLITNVNRTRERWMEVIQQTLDETEYFNASLDIQEFSALVPFLLDPEGAAQSTDIVGIGWTGGSDPDGHIEELQSSDFHVPDGFNWNLYSNEEVDELIEEGQTTVDVDERREVYQELQELLAQESPSAWMWTSDQIDVVDTTSVDGWQAYPNSSFRYWALYRPSVDVIAEPA